MLHNILEYFKLPEGVYIPFFGWRWYSFITKLENIYIKKADVPDNPLNMMPREEKIIISLTSYPARINVACFAIKSLMRQTVKPDKIVLWLAEEQFPDKLMPDNLKILQTKGLEIRYCKDLKSHKKYYYAMQEQGNNLLITYDDDLIYPPNSIELLMKYHRKYPNCIICNRGFEIVFKKNDEIKSVEDWKLITKEGINAPSLKIMPSTGGGCLYPPNAVSEIVYDWELIKKYALSADDLWMKAMSLLKGTQVIKTKKYSKPFSIVENSQKEHLGYTNIILGQNNIVVNNLLKLFPTLFDELKK